MRRVSGCGGRHHRQGCSASCGEHKDRGHPAPPQDLLYLATCSASSGISVKAVDLRDEHWRLPRRRHACLRWRRPDDTSLAAAGSASKLLWASAKSLTRAQNDGAEDKVIAWSAGGNDRKIKGNDYVQQFALPNFFFFVTTAYESCAIVAFR